MSHKSISIYRMQYASQKKLSDVGSDCVTRMITLLSFCRRACFWGYSRRESIKLWFTETNQAISQ